LISYMCMYWRTIAFAFLLPFPVTSVIGSGSAGDDGSVADIYLHQSARHPVIEYNSQLMMLKVNAEQYCLDEILAAISESTNIEFIDLGNSGCDKVSIMFDYLPLKVSLKHVLRGRSYIVKQGINDSTSVWLLPVGDVERLTDVNVKVEEFYETLSGSQEAQYLADQIRSLE